ncbi:MAG TPA: hypothetical protein VF054_16025 [Micromonosporaceae bacterium]
MTVRIGGTTESDVVATVPVRSGDRPPWARFLRRHIVLASLLVVGVALRVLYLVAYPPAFFVYQDSQLYVHAARSGVLDPSVPFGYSAFLALFAPSGSFTLVAVAQHLIGIGTALLVYAFLLRRGLPGWLAAIPTVPLLLDAWQLAFEHYLMSDVLFTALLVAALVTLLWRDPPGVGRCAASGLLLAAAGLTRTVGLPLVGLVLLYLLVRRVGWRAVAVFAAVVAATVVGYAGIYAAQHGTFGLGGDNARRFYGRAAQIVDCDRVATLTARERQLCPAEPLGQRHAADWYGLYPQSPAAKFAPNDPIFSSFDSKVFAAQPLDLGYEVAREFGYFFRSGDPTDRNACLDTLWVPQPGRPALDWCYPHLASGTGFDETMPRDAAPRPSWASGVLQGYDRWTRTPGWTLVLAVVLALVAAVRARSARGTDVAAGRGMPLLLGCGVALLAGAVAGAMFDVRYALPALWAFWTAGAVAIHQIMPARHTRQVVAGRGGTDEPAPAPTG